MGLMFLLILGAILGWLAAIILNEESMNGLFGNVGAGIVGAILAGLIISPIVGGGSLLGESYSVGALLLSLIGSLGAIVAANLYRRVHLH